MKVPAYIVWVLVQFLLTFIASNLKEWHHYLFQIKNHGTGDEIAAMPMPMVLTTKPIYQTDNNEAQQNRQGSDREKDSAVRCYCFCRKWLPLVYVPKNQYAAIPVSLKISSSTSTLTEKDLKAAHNATTDLELNVLIRDGGMGYNGKKLNCPKPDPCHDEAEKRIQHHLGFNIICSCVLFLVYMTLIAVSHLYFRSTY